MAIKSAHRGILDAMFAAPIAENNALAELRASIIARTASKSDRLAVIRNESDDEELRAGISFLSDLKSQIEALTSQANEVEDAINAKVEAIFAATPQDGDLAEDKRKFVEGRKSLIASLDAIRKVAPALVGSEEVLSEYLEEIGWEEVATIRGGQTRSGNVSGIKRPRLSFVSVNGTEMDKATLSAAATYISKVSGTKVTSQDLQAAYHGEALNETEAVWDFAVPGMGGNGPTVYTLATKPRENVEADVDVDDDESDDED